MKIVYAVLVKQTDISYYYLGKLNKHSKSNFLHIARCSTDPNGQPGTINLNPNIVNNFSFFFFSKLFACPFFLQINNTPDGSRISRFVLQPGLFSIVGSHWVYSCTHRLSSRSFLRFIRYHYQHPISIMTRTMY